MTIGSLGYVVNDALIRQATEEGLDVFQALFLRSIGMAVLFGAATRIRGERVSLHQLRGPLAVRVGAEVLGSALFFTALIHLDFANAQTMLLIVPFAVTFAAALVLGEHVTGRQYATVIAGFIGVLLVVQPATDGFSWWSLAVVASAAFLVVREFATRRLPADISASSIALATAIGLAMLTGATSMFTGWEDLSATATATVGLAGVCLVVGYIFTIQAVRVGDLSASAPFRYTTLLGAVVLGYLFFDEIPGALTFGGCAAILLSGLYAIRLEQRGLTAKR